MKLFCAFCILVLSILLILPDSSFASSLLADAIEHGDTETAYQLIKQKPDINAMQVDGMTALHWAVYHDDLKLVSTLLDHQANVSMQNRYGVSPLSLACLNGNAKIIAMLLEHGADANTTLRGGESVLHTAARNGRVNPVRLLIASGADVNAKELKKQSPLMWAAAEGHIEVVKELIESGADVDYTLGSGFNAFFFAVREGHTDVVHALLDHGVAVNGLKLPPDNQDAERGLSALLLAVENGHFDLAVSLLERGADPNDQRSGYTPLHTLTWVRKPNRGDNGTPSPVGSGNRTSLQMAQELVKHGADVNARLERGSGGRGRIHKIGATPFLMAADTADIPYMHLLLEMGADPLIPNKDGCTPLMAAAGLGTIAPSEEAGTETEALEAVKLILSLGGDMNRIDKNGETAMHGAAYASFPRMVKFLADHGAEASIWNQENEYGWSPLIIATGYRVGNFKPSFETVDAIRAVMLAAGITPPDDPKPKELKRKGYEN